MQYRGYHCAGGSVEVNRKGTRLANIDFADLGVKRYVREIRNGL